MSLTCAHVADTLKTETDQPPPTPETPNEIEAAPTRVETDPVLEEPNRIDALTCVETDAMEQDAQCKRFAADAS